MSRDPTDALPARLQDLQARYLQSEEAVTATKIVLPIAVGLLYLLSIPILFRGAWESFAGFIFSYVVPPAGKESVIPAAIIAGFHPVSIAFYIAALDAIVGLWIVWNYDLAFRVPGLRYIVTKAQESGEAFIEGREWMEDVAFIGLVVFVMIPFQGSGAIAAAFVGRAISVDPDRVWYAIVTGAFVGSFTIAFLGQSVVFAFQQALGTGIAMVVGFVLVFAAGIFLYLRGGSSRNPREPP